LQNLNITKLPIIVLKIFANVETLDLSENRNIDISKEWFSVFKDKIKVLKLKNCRLKNEDLKVISMFEKFEILDISENKYLNINHLYSEKTNNSLKN